jgi:haloalkane dehalogenase
MGYSPVPLDKTFRSVKGSRLAYAEFGTGSPIVLLHGNPTSSYLWRNVVPHLAGSGRVIVPDLIGQDGREALSTTQGQGRSSLATASACPDGPLGSIGVTSDVTPVLHDGGRALGYHWACSDPPRA